MTKDQLKEEIKTEITGGGLIPNYLGEAELDRVIKQTERFFYLKHRDASKPFSFIIKKETFDCEEFKNNRQLILPDNIDSVEEVKELRAHTQFLAADVSPERLLASEMYLFSINNQYDLVMRAAAESYYDLTRAFMLNQIAFTYSNNDHTLILHGRTPAYDVLLKTNVKLDPTDLYDDYYFGRYAACQAKISLCRMLTFIGDGLSLGQGLKLNVSDMMSEAASELEKIEESVKNLDPPDWILLYN